MAEPMRRRSASRRFVRVGVRLAAVGDGRDAAFQRRGLVVVGTRRSEKEIQLVLYHSTDLGRFANGTAGELQSQTVVVAGRRSDCIDVVVSPEHPRQLGLAGQRPARVPRCLGQPCHSGRLHTVFALGFPFPISSLRTAPRFRRPALFSTTVGLHPILFEKIDAVEIARR